MNGNELRAEMMRCGVSMKELSIILGIDRSTLYKKITGKTQFLQSEIAKITETLNLNSDRMIAIFFRNKVS